MKFKTLALTSAISSAFLMTSITSVAQELEITVSNLTNGIHFTPLLVAAHDANTFAFRSGTEASEELAILAEGGNNAPLKTLLDNANANTSTHSEQLAPGESAALELSTSDDNNLLSLTAMLLPTNDGFVGLGSWKIPTEAGTYSINLNAYDAGTEANDEIIVAGGDVLGVAGIPGCPGDLCGSGASGVTTTESNTKVHIHRNVLGDSDDAGGISDLDNTAHRWLNPVARITITVK
jgi:hypothetical protein